MNSPSTDPKQIRAFGGVGLLIFFMLGLNLFLKDHPYLVYFVAFLWVQALGFLAFPRLMIPVYKGWLKVSQFIGNTINAVFLTLMFFIGIAPFALLKKVIKFGGPDLPARPDPEADSYWVPRTEPVQPRKRFIKRY